MQSAVPREAIGYVADLGSEMATPEMIADRLAMLERHCPELVAQYRAAIAKATQ